MNTATDMIRRWFAKPVFGSAELQDKAQMVQVFTFTLFFALFIPTLIRPLSDLFRPITFALTLQQMILAAAFWLNRRGRVDAAVIMTVFGLLGMTAFIMLASSDGVHDIAILVFPSVLVVAGILLDLRLFFAFTFCNVLLYALLVYLEMSGTVRSAMSGFTTIQDTVDGLLILVLTSFVVGMLTQSLQRTIARVRRSEADLVRSNEEMVRQSRMLRESEARYRLVVETALDPIVSTDFRGRFLFANAAAARLSGYAIEDLLCMNFFDFCLPEHRHRIRRALFRQVADRESNRSHEFALQSRSGDAIWLSTSVSLELKEGVPSGFHVVARDITDKRQAEDEVRRLNQDLEDRVRLRTAELEAAMNELQNISYSVSHDLRAPLRHISAYAEMTQIRPSVRDDAPAFRHLQTISFSAKWMGLLVDGLIDYLSIGQTEMHVVEVDLGELVRGVIRDLEPEVIGRFIRWKVGPLPRVNGDRRLLRQAFANIIANAVKFTQSRQEAVIEIGTTSGEEREPGQVVFVRDNGIGFDPQYQEQLFGLFQRLHSRAEHAGAGIGLANVRRIIHRHGGRVWAEGAVDRGATFSVVLPVLIDPAVEGSRPVHQDASLSEKQPDL